jgi:hypothetical protein
VRIHPVLLLMVVLLLPSSALARNLPGIVVAPQPSPGLVLMLPAPSAAKSPDARHKSGRALAERVLSELLKPQSDNGLTKSTKLFATGGTSVDEIDRKRMREFLAGCTVEAAGDLPSVANMPAEDYFIVQLACPYEGRPNAKRFAAVGLTNGSVVSVVLNVILTPIWSERG